MDDYFDGFPGGDVPIQDGAIAAASTFGKTFTLWAKRHAFELEELFGLVGPNHFGKAERQVAWLGKKIFNGDAPAFDPDMTVEDVIETYCQGQIVKDVRDYLGDLLNYQPAHDAPFPEPWIDGSQSDGYTISPIRTADELWDEGDRMHNCVANYVPDVIGGEAFFYHVSKDGDRAATVQLAKAADRYVIEEIKGLCNAEVPKVVLHAVERWIATAG